MKNTLPIMIILLGWSATAGAELVDRGNGLIYDDVLDVTWLQDASAGDRGGWEVANAWADSLEFGGFDDWRLPSMDVDGDQSVVNCNGATEPECRDNELGYMYYHNLDGIFGTDLSGDQGLIQGLATAHWSGTELAGLPGSSWLFLFASGVQESSSNSLLLGIWAVRDGDVGIDSDGDGVVDSVDNCTDVSNPDQRDTNGDGFGNICDPDLDNNGVVNFGDVALWIPFFNTTTSGDEDFNGDGFANFGDYALFMAFFQNPPGPSGVAP